MAVRTSSEITSSDKYYHAIPVSFYEDWFAAIASGGRDIPATKLRAKKGSALAPGQAGQTGVQAAEHSPH